MAEHELAQQPLELGLQEPMPPNQAEATAALSDEQLDQVAGGRQPAPAGPVPLPYPNDR